MGFGLYPGQKNCPVKGSWVPGIGWGKLQQNSWADLLRYHTDAKIRKKDPGCANPRHDPSGTARTDCHRTTARGGARGVWLDRHMMAVPDGSCLGLGDPKLSTRWRLLNIDLSSKAQQVGSTGSDLGDAPRFEGRPSAGFESAACGLAERETAEEGELLDF